VPRGASLTGIKKEDGAVESGEVECGGQSGWPAADDENIGFEMLFLRMVTHGRS
jgi:hypothetical protein